MSSSLYFTDEVTVGQRREQPCSVSQLTVLTQVTLLVCPPSVCCQLDYIMLVSTSQMLPNSFNFKYSISQPGNMLNLLEPYSHDKQVTSADGINLILKLHI